MQTFLCEHNNVRILMNLEKIYNAYYPNIQAEFNGSLARIALDLSMIEGRLPAEKMIEVFDWIKIHYEELDEEWMKLIRSKTFKKVN